MPYDLLSNLPSGWTLASPSLRSCRALALALALARPLASPALALALRHCAVVWLTTNTTSCFLLPAIICSIISGGVAPFMTYVIGQAFDGFARFPTSSPTQDDKHTLLHAVGLAAIQLVGLAAASLALSSITSSLWIWTGEQNVMAIRKVVYQSVTTKDLDWFDSNAHGDGPSEQDAPIGAGGLMSKFAKCVEGSLLII